MIENRDIVFSNLLRGERINKAEKCKFDLIIVGGGITGAGIALDASLRGLKTLLVEKLDFASGTSSKSTKLIHGGLRYLKQFEFGLVRETGLERAVVHKNIPHLVHPETMLLPIVNNGEFNQLTASLAINVYDLLAKVEKKDRKKSLQKEQVEIEEPLLNKSLLKSAVAYSEYRTDDARLTIELIKAARREGAETFNYMQLDSFIYENDKIIGINCTDNTDESKISFHSKFVVSAAGPWVDELRKKDNSKKGKSLHLTKGVHIVVPKERLALNNSVYFDAFDGRMIFAIPRGKVTYIGTSDTSYSKSLNRVLCTKEDVEYLLEKTNMIFDKANLIIDDVVSSWAGLRPLIHEDGKSPSELSRKDEIFISDSNLISIAGGKLTGFRKMSKKVVNLLLKRDSSFNQVKCKTRSYKIHADSFANYREFQAYQEEILIEFSGKGIDSYTSWYLCSTYGKNARYILLSALKIQELNLEKALIKAEIEYVIQYESAYSPDDYFNRRSGKLYFDINGVKANFNFILAEFKEHFNWSEEKLIIERIKCQELIDDVSVFR